MGDPRGIRRLEAAVGPVWELQRQRTQAVLWKAWTRSRRGQPDTSVLPESPEGPQDRLPF